MSFRPFFIIVEFGSCWLELPLMFTPTLNKASYSRILTTYLSQSIPSYALEY